jgi:hypothetical protein
LRAQQFEQPAFGFFIVGLHKSEAFAGKIFPLILFPPEGQQALASDYLKMPFFVAPTNVAAVDANRQWAIWRWQLVPVSLSAFDKRPLLLAQLVLQPLRHAAHMLANGGGVHRRIHGQRVFQEFRGHVITHE